MNLAPLPESEDDAAELNKCSLKGCDNPGTWLPLFSVCCKGPKGRGPNATRLTSTLPTPMCDDHIHLPTMRDYRKYIDWHKLHLEFIALDLPGPKRSTSRLEWVKAQTTS